LKSEARVLALLPAVLVAILTFWSGDFSGAATATGALTTQTALLGFCLLGIREISDPLRLGPAGRWLLPALLALTVVSWWFSPVARAGTLGLLLLPAFLLIPASTARCWSSAKTLNLGLTALASLVLTVALVAILTWQISSLPRASLPLGHHNLLALWLILVLPLAVAGIRQPGPPRWLALAAGTGALVALGATGSLLGALAVGTQLAMAALWWPRIRIVALSLTSLAVLSTLPRWTAILQSSDLSALARRSYLAAGWQGLLARPGTGWGPGAVPWTLGSFMQPAAGIHPASQIVADLHCLPAQIGYELGFAGILLSLAIVGIFARQRWKKDRDDTQPIVRRTALLGLLGGGIFSLGAAPLAVPALPATALVVVGASFSGEAPAGRRFAPFWWAYVAVAAVALLPLDRAHFQYDRARLAPSAGESLAWLARARNLDSAFPLYLAREAWLTAELQGADRPTAERARQAAELAPGLAPLWLEAGYLGRTAGADWAPHALATAYRLDPLSPLTAFHLMTVTADSTTATRLGAEALRQEPRLTGAIWWLDRPDLARSVSTLAQVPVPAPGTVAQRRAPALALGFDRRPSLSFSLFAFRRSPWPGRLAAVQLGTDSD
jgi:hypothetical protein